MSENLTPEKALFIERKVKEYLDHTTACLDRAQTEGTMVLQWLFGVVVAGLGLVGSIVPKGYWSIARKERPSARRKGLLAVARSAADSDDF
jgi:hypothetical protein